MGSIRTGTAFCAVGQLPGNENAALAADLHAINAQIQTGHGATARSLEEAKRLGGLLFWFSIRPHHRLEVFIVYRAWGVIVGRVELVAVRGKPNGVVKRVDLIGLGDCAGAELHVLVLQREGGLENSSGGWNAGWEFDAGGGRGSRMGYGLGCRRGCGLCRCNSGGRHKKSCEKDRFHGNGQLQSFLTDVSRREFIRGGEALAAHYFPHF